MKTILIIEDNTEVRENTAEILELANYKVLQAENGKIGVEIANSKHIDLIICDIMMPVLDGYGVIHLLSNNPKTANIPFVAGQKLPKILDTLVNPLIVGLLLNPERLVEIRKNRLINLNEVTNYNYTDNDLVYKEVAEAKKIYQQHGWPIIDVTRKSVEETSANIIKMYEQRRVKFTRD